MSERRMTDKEFEAIAAEVVVPSPSALFLAEARRAREREEEWQQAALRFREELDALRIENMKLTGMGSAYEAEKARADRLEAEAGALRASAQAVLEFMDEHFDNDGNDWSNVRAATVCDELHEALDSDAGKSLLADRDQLRAKVERLEKDLKHMAGQHLHERTRGYVHCVAPDDAPAACWFVDMARAALAEEGK